MITAPESADQTIDEDTAADDTPTNHQWQSAARRPPDHFGHPLRGGCRDLHPILINNVADGILSTFVVAPAFGIALGLPVIAENTTMPTTPKMNASSGGNASTPTSAGFTVASGPTPCPCSIAIDLTARFGFPGTMILSQEAAQGAGESPDEVEPIEGQILPKMIAAGFATFTIRR